MSNPYAVLKTTLARGWNTWNTRSVLSHVLLPEAFAINLGLRHPTDGRYLKEALFGKNGEDIRAIVTQRDLVEKSKALILKEWQELGHVHENYNADTGEGCDKSASSDAVYHWADCWDSWH